MVRRIYLLLFILSKQSPIYSSGFIERRPRPASNGRHKVCALHAQHLFSGWKNLINAQETLQYNIAYNPQHTNWINVFVTIVEHLLVFFFVRRALTCCLSYDFGICETARIYYGTIWWLLFLVMNLLAMLAVLWRWKNRIMQELFTKIPNLKIHLFVNH